MRDFSSELPTLVANKIGTQISEAVSATERVFPRQRGNEDSVTGSLGGQLMDKVQGTMAIGDKQYIWITDQYTIRGIARNAPESRYGADALIEVSIIDPATGEIIATKALPFQAKKDSSSAGLLKQVEDMKRLSCSGIVIDYKDDGFTAMHEEDIISANGNITAVPDSKKKKLADMLADDFLNCRIGRQKFTYSVAAERMIDLSDVNEPRIINFAFKPSQVIEVKIWPVDTLEYLLSSPLSLERRQFRR